MINSKHWMVCVDLTKMDHVLLGYTSFLASVSKPKTVTFLHVVESGPETLEIMDQFPEINTKEKFFDLLRGEINEKIETHFTHDEPEVRVVIKEGKPTAAIIDLVNSLEPDLLVVGKKVGYAGEGIIPKRILKYVATSILFVPENSRHALENILVAVDFSEQSAKALKTGQELSERTGAKVTAQHIYEYRAQFFPYMLSEKEKDKVDNETKENREKFIRDYNVPESVNVKLSKHNKGKIADTVYDEVLKSQADVIIVASKAKKIPGMMRQDFTDRMVNYAFGIPLLVLRNKERYQKFLKKLFDE
ncbi:MAG: universal stress protein [Balneolaceae bacterium]|nr:MAG: universal stress protein [Balneolaceae bacterium]